MNGVVSGVPTFCEFQIGWMSVFLTRKLVGRLKLCDEVLENGDE